MWSISVDPQQRDAGGRDGDLYRAEISEGPASPGVPVWIEASSTLGAPYEMVREALAEYLRRGGPPPRKLILSSPPDETVDPPYTVRAEY